MELKPINAFPHVQPLDICFGCSKAEDEFSSIESDEDELSYALLDHYLDKHRTVKPKEITNRPCFHCLILQTPVGKLNLAALQLSYDLIENIEHLPKIIESVDICAPDNFYKLVGCTKDSIDVYSDLIVAKLIPEDVEDENNYELFFEYLVDKKKIALIGLPCKIFKAFYLLPLPKEEEPPVFMPIANRLNLEKAPREDNYLLGLLVRKPPREEGEISEKEDIPVTIKEVSRPSKSQLLSPVSSESDPFSPESPPMSSKKPNSSKGSSKDFDSLPPISVPKNRYDSYIGRSTETIPFLTDAIDVLQNKAGSSKKDGTKKNPATLINENLEKISSESENELEYATQESSNRKRSRSISIDVKTKASEHTQNKVRASSSSSFFNALREKSQSSNTLTTTIEKVPSEKSKPVPNSKHDVKTCEPKNKFVSPEIIDVNDSSNSDPDSDFFPRKSNTMLSGTFFTNLGSFEFKYHSITSNRKNVTQYLPSCLQQKGRANTAETELFLTSEMQKPEKKVIAFQILPKDTADDKRLFGSYVSDLHSRTRYGLLDYTPDAYRAYVFPCVKGYVLMKAFEICNLKPSFTQACQLYGIIVKKSGPKESQSKARHRSTSITSVEMPSPTSSLPVKVPASSSSRDNAPQKELSFETESSDYQEENMNFKNYPGLESNKLIEAINSSIGDLCKLSATLTTMVHKAIDGQALEVKIGAAEQCRRKLQLIIAEDERQFAKRQQAYQMALDILTTIHNSLSNSKS